MARGKLAALAALVVLACAPTAIAATPEASGRDPASLPIIQIHGFDSQDCPGSDASYGWAPFDYVLRGAGWTGPLLPVSFYECDTNGADITGYGPDTPAVASPDVTPDAPRAGYDQNVSLTTIAHDLAWYLYRNFSQHGQPVDIVALSMGGLIARIAIHRVQSGDPAFPPRLLVARSITFSTPHHGIGTVAGNAADPGCHHLLQCQEWASDSPLMTELMRDATDPQGSGGTRWTVIGSSAGCDFLPVPSATGLPHAQQVDFPAPCYSHIGYFWDVRPEHEATTVIKDGDDGVPVTNTAAQYSLPFATSVLLQPVAAVPVVAPLPRITTTAGRVGIRFSSGGGTGDRSFELRYRTAVGTAELGAWQTVTAPSDGVTVPPGLGATQLCAAARASAGQDVSRWSEPTCTAIPVDDRKLSRSARWQAMPSAAAYAGTLSRSARAGDAASTTVRGTGVAVLARQCASCGSVQVLLDGVPWRVFDLRAPRTRPVTRELRWSSEKTVRVTLRTRSAAPVYLDGLAGLR